MRTACKISYPIDPASKPRMTRRDKWKGRKCVVRYNLFKDHCRLLKVHVPESGARVIFYMPMPKSWSKKKKDQMCMKPCRSKGRNDIDNLLKALLDAVYGDDSGVWDIRATKLWAHAGAITIITE